MFLCVLSVCALFLAPTVEGRRKCRIISMRDCAIGCTKFKTDDRGCPTCKCDEDIEDVIEGDIKVDEVTSKQLSELAVVDGENYPERGGVKDTIVRRWNLLQNSNGMYEVPYAISPNISPQTEEAINAAIQDYRDKTCILFRPKLAGETEYIQFFSDRGCYSYIGRRTGSNAPNPVSLSPGCGHKGIVIHELLHALGFLHEQSRTDRDNFITIHYENIPSANVHNFKRYSNSIIDSMESPYDMGSIMHYGSYAFSKNGKPTITDKKGKVFKSQRTGFSVHDLKQLNTMYECNGVTGNSLKPTESRVVTTNVPDSTVSEVSTDSPNSALVGKVGEIIRDVVKRLNNAVKLLNAN